MEKLTSGSAMDETEKIKERLSLLEARCLTDYSLYNGKTGLSMACFMLAKITDEKSYAAKAALLLNELSEEIATVKELNFENGLSGIGWGIEWLVQNDFIEANTNEILEDLDDELYKAVVYAKSPDLSLSKGTIGRAMYFYKRLCARNFKVSRYRHICNQECFVLLIDEIHDHLLNEAFEIPLHKVTENRDGTFEIAQALLFLAKIYHTKINAEITKRLICAISAFTNQYFLSEQYKHAAGGEDLYLVYAVYKAGCFLKDNHFLNMAQRAYPLYRDSRSIYDMVDPVYDFMDNTLSISLLKAVPTAAHFSGPGIFNVLRAISNLPGAALYNWEEGWGL
jgi:hypothetical protein